MFFYILIIPTLVWIIIKTIKLKKIEKHDVVLFRFCQIRRDIMSFLRKEGLNLTKEEYISFKKFLDAINGTIHYYDEFKTSLFNLRRFVDYFKDVRKTATELEKFEPPQEIQIANLYKEFIHAWFLAFFAYTPLLKYELGLKITIALVKKFAHSYYQSLLVLMAILKKLSDKFEVPQKVTKPIVAVVTH